MRHLMSPLDFSVEELDQLMDLANDIEKHPEKYAHACDGKRLATLFYEPSTRTRLSFEAAMMNLGGTVLGFSSANSSSASWRPVQPPCRSSTPAMVDISTRRRLLPIFLPSVL